MTDKQTKTLLLYAQNYSIIIIAKKLRVAESTIRRRLKKLQVHYSQEFMNAQGIRDSYKRLRDGMRKMLVQQTDKRDYTEKWYGYFKHKF